MRRRKLPFTKGEWTKLGRYFPATFNPGSDKQVREWLFGTLGVRPSTRTDGGAPSVDMDALHRILSRKPRNKSEASVVDRATPVIHNLMHRSRLAKIDQDYLDPEVHNGREEGSGEGSRGPQHDRERHASEPESHGDLGEGRSREGGPAVRSVVQDRRGGSTASSNDRSGNLRTGRVYPTIKMNRAINGRNSWADPPVHSWPPEIRHFVKARPGYLILGADYRAGEVRTFAHLTGDRADLEVLENNRLDPHNPEWDMHIRRACDLVGWDLPTFLSKDATTRKGLRDASKTFTFGVIQYGGSPEESKAKIKCVCPRCERPSELNFTATERRRQADRWFARHPEARMYRENVSQFVRKHHFYENPFGKIIYYHMPFGNDLERLAWNWPCSSSLADILRRAAVALDAEGAPLILEHHDALYMEVAEGEVDKWAKLMVEVMEQPVPEFGHAIFPCELQVGPSWGEMEDHHV